MRPDQRSRRCAVRVDLAVGRADVQAPERQGRCRVEARAAVQARLSPRLPDELPALRPDAVDVAVVRAEIDAAGRERGCALDRPACAIRPDRLARARVECPQASLPVADVQTVADEERRALGRADRLRPANLAEARRKCHHLAGAPGARSVARRLVEEGLVDRAALVRADCGRCCDAPARAVDPRPLAGLRVQRSDDAGVGREVEAPVRDCGRELDEAACVVPPDLAERRFQCELHRAVTCGVESVLRPRHVQRRRRGPRRRRRQRELLGGRAADVPRPVQAVDDDRRDRAGQQHGDRSEDDERAPHDGGSRYPGCTIVPS